MYNSDTGEINMKQVGKNLLKLILGIFLLVAIFKSFGTVQTGQMYEL